MPSSLIHVEARHDQHIVTLSVNHEISCMPTFRLIIPQDCHWRNHVTVQTGQWIECLLNSDLIDHIAVIGRHTMRVYFLQTASWLSIRRTISTALYQSPSNQPTPCLTWLN